MKIWVNNVVMILAFIILMAVINHKPHVLAQAISENSDSANKLPLAGVKVSRTLDGWPESHLIDDQPDTFWSSSGHTDHLSSSDWVAVILPAATDVDLMRIFPRTNPLDATASLGFPKDFVIEYAFNGSGHTCDPRDPNFAAMANWLALVSRTGYGQPGSAAIDFSFLARQAGCLRIMGVEESQDDYGVRYMQLAEIELYSNHVNLKLSGVKGSTTLDGWPENNLVDGKPDTSWSSTGNTEHLLSSNWAAVILTAATDVERMRIYPRINPLDATGSLGFPKDFVIQYAYNGSKHTCDPIDPNFAAILNWEPLITRYGYSQPGSAAIDFNFLARQAGCLRILGVEESQDEYGIRSMQLAEIELYSSQQAKERLLFENFWKIFVPYTLGYQIILILLWFDYRTKFFSKRLKGIRIRSFKK